MSDRPSTQLDQRYETDFAAWVETTAQLLREGRFAELDLENLIEEVESLSRSDQREIRSRLIKLLSHRLKYDYQPEKRSDSWIATMMEQRRQIALILEDSPSLNRYLSQVFAPCYTKARTEASEETGLAIDTFPAVCPFTEAEALTSSLL